MKTFGFYLVSNADLQNYPDNKLTSFKNNLPDQIILDNLSDYEIAITSLQIQNPFIYSEEQIHDISIFLYEIVGKIKNNKVTKEILKCGNEIEYISGKFLTYNAKNPEYFDFTTKLLTTFSISIFANNSSFPLKLKDGPPTIIKCEIRKKMEPNFNLTITSDKTDKTPFNEKWKFSSILDTPIKLGNGWIVGLRSLSFPTVFENLDVQHENIVKAFSEQTSFIEFELEIPLAANFDRTALILSELLYDYKKVVSFKIFAPDHFRFYYKRHVKNTEEDIRQLLLIITTTLKQIGISFHKVSDVFYFNLRNDLEGEYHISFSPTLGRLFRLKNMFHSITVTNQGNVWDTISSEKIGDEEIADEYEKEIVSETYFTIEPIWGPDTERNIFSVHGAQCLIEKKWTEEAKKKCYMETLLEKKLNTDYELDFDKFKIDYIGGAIKITIKQMEHRELRPFLVSMFSRFGIKVEFINRMSFTGGIMNFKLVYPFISNFEVKLSENLQFLLFIAREDNRAYQEEMFEVDVLEHNRRIDIDNNLFEEEEEKYATEFEIYEPMFRKVNSHQLELIESKFPAYFMIYADFIEDVFFGSSRLPIIKAIAGPVSGADRARSEVKTIDFENIEYFKVKTSELSSMNVNIRNINGDKIHFLKDNIFPVQLNLHFKKEK